MHNLAIAQSLFDLMIDEAYTANADRVTAVYIHLGMMSDIEPESVRHFFDVLSQNSIAAGAWLCFERTTPQARCLDCGTMTGLPTVRAAGEPWIVIRAERRCTCCGGTHFALERGDEFILDRIEIERVL